MIIVTLREIRNSSLDEAATRKNIQPLAADALFREVEKPQQACYFCDAPPSRRRHLYAYFMLNSHLVEVCCTKCKRLLDKLGEQK